MTDQKELLTLADDLNGIPTISNIGADIRDRAVNALRQADADKVVMEKLKGFAAAIMLDWPEVPAWDGGDLQEIALKHGVLYGTTVTEPCGENCTCQEYVSTDEMKAGITCYRLTDLAAIDEREKDSG